jgi:hypothetical protein
MIAAVVLAAGVAAAPALDAQHQMLADLSGHWTVKQSLWLDASGKARVDMGSADFAMVLKGRHLKQTLHIADGTGFEGLGYIGYDNATGQFSTTWMDVNFPGIVVAYGAKDGDDYVLKGSMGAVPVREVLKIVDHDHIDYRFYETHDGKEALVVELEYSR